MTFILDMFLNYLTMLKIFLYITIHKPLMISHLKFLSLPLVLLLIRFLELEFPILIRIDEIQQELNIKTINYNVATLFINEKHQISKT